MLTLAISDVPGDDPATIGSGPTVPDPTTLADARAVLARRRPAMQALGLTLPPAVDAALADPANETPKPGDPAFATAEYRIDRHPGRGARRGRRGGEASRLRGDRPRRRRSPARRARWPRAHAALAREAKAAGRRVAIISGGELSVTVRNAQGRGGRNQEYALALALALDGLRRRLRAGGRHGRHRRRHGQVTDPAGAIIDAATLRGRAPPRRPEVPRQ